MTSHSSNSSNRGYLDYIPVHNELTELEREAIRTLVLMGTRIACMRLTKWKSQPKREFETDVLERARCSMSVLDSRNSTDAVVAVTGETFDVIDIDPRNGGEATWKATQKRSPQPFALASTPGNGRHLYVPPTGLRTKRLGGIDYLAERSWLYLPGTRRPKYSGAGYTWIQPPNLDLLARPCPGYPAALEALRRTEASFQVHLGEVGGQSAWEAASNQPFLGRKGRLTILSNYVARANLGERNSSLHWAARTFVDHCGNSPALLDTAERYLLHACQENNLLSDEGEASCRATIQSGFRAALHTKEV